MKEAQYKVKVEWKGNLGNGTKNYTSYNRNHTISGIEKSSEILGSTDPSFMGDKTMYTPEELLVSSISSCHMLSYLHLCAINKIIVTDYTDTVTEIMTESKDGYEKIKEITLNPIVTVANEDMIQKATDLHHEANKKCFIINSCNFTVKHCAKILMNK